MSMGPDRTCKQAERTWHKSNTDKNNCSSSNNNNSGEDMEQRGLVHPQGMPMA